MLNDSLDNVFLDFFFSRKKNIIFQIRVSVWAIHFSWIKKPTFGLAEALLHYDYAYPGLLVYTKSQTIMILKKRAREFVFKSTYTMIAFLRIYNFLSKPIWLIESTFWKFEIMVNAMEVLVYCFWGKVNLFVDHNYPWDHCYQVD